MFASSTACTPPKRTETFWTTRTASDKDGLLELLRLAPQAAAQPLAEPRHLTAEAVGVAPDADCGQPGQQVRDLRDVRHVVLDDREHRERRRPEQRTGDGVDAADAKGQEQR